MKLMLPVLLAMILSLNSFAITSHSVRPGASGLEDATDDSIAQALKALERLGSVCLANDSNGGSDKSTPPPSGPGSSNPGTSSPRPSGTGSGDKQPATGSPGAKPDTKPGAGPTAPGPGPVGGTTPKPPTLKSLQASVAVAAAQAHAMKDKIKDEELKKKLKKFRNLALEIVADIEAKKE